MTKSVSFRLISLLVQSLTLWRRTLALVASSSFPFAVPRIPVSEFIASRHYYSDEYRVETPVIVENVLGDNCSAYESLAEELIEAVSSFPITLQRKQEMFDNTTITDVYDCTVEQAIDLVMQSKHGDSLFAFCEGLLQSKHGFFDEKEGVYSSGDVKKLDAIHQTIRGAMSHVFRQDTRSSHDRDWFDFFPEQIRPSDCVVIAGEGATSTLHRDPFEWTGTSICLEGSKVWRFIPPVSVDHGISNADEWRAHRATHGHEEDFISGVEEVDASLKSYRLTSVAWDDDLNGNTETEHLPLSAGWQSDYSFFSHKSKSVPSARALAGLETAERVKTLEGIASSAELLSPNVEMLPNRPFWTATQRAGDLLIIPAYWWHQTYAVEPSIAVASQRCDSRRDAARMIKHVLSTTHTTANAPKVLLKEDYSNDSPSEVVSSLFVYLRKFL